MAQLPEMTPVQSSNVKALGFQGGLFVQFNNGTAYKFPMVPRKLYEQGLKAESAGRWFSSEIRGKYEGQKLG